MTISSNRPPQSHREPKPPSFGAGHFVVGILLAILFFLLLQGMVRSHFHQGGRPNPVVAPYPATESTVAN
jgi:hypothetical protein